MSLQKLLQQGIRAALVIGFLAGCTIPIAAPSISETPVAILKTAVATPTPIPPTRTATPLPGPKVGHWAGGNQSSDSHDKLTGSFDVTNDGDIQNFEMVIELGGGFSCTIKVEKIIVKADYTFLFVMSATSNKGETIEDALHIDGKFDNATTVSGILSFKVCEDMVSAPGPRTNSWKADWNRP